MTLRKIPSFYLISWCRNFVERHSFRIVSPKTMRKLCLSTKFPHQKIRWNYGLFAVLGNWNFESDLEWHIQSVNPNSMEFGSKNIDRPIFKLKLWKTHLNLQTFQQLCSMTSAYLDKMSVCFLKLSILRIQWRLIYANVYVVLEYNFE